MRLQIQKERTIIQTAASPPFGQRRTDAMPSADMSKALDSGDRDF